MYVVIYEAYLFVVVNVYCYKTDVEIMFDSRFELLLPTYRLTQNKLPFSFEPCIHHLPKLLCLVNNALPNNIPFSLHFTNY